MISICTVEITTCKDHLAIMLESVGRLSTSIKEIIIAVSDAQEPFEEITDLNGIKVVRFGNPVPDLWYGHGLGLNAALERTTQEYVMLSDPDVFWYCDVGTYWHELMKEYDLNYIGVSHHNGPNQAGTFFPYVISTMARRETLPDKDWMKGKLKFRGPILTRGELIPGDDYPFADGKFLIPNPLPELCDLYPNKNHDAIFDVGCNMWLWNEERKGRWLSFQTRDCNLYTADYCRGNFKPNPKLARKKLLFHCCNSCKGEPEQMLKYKTAYEESKC